MTTRARHKPTNRRRSASKSSSQTTSKASSTTASPRSSKTPSKAPRRNTKATSPRRQKLTPPISPPNVSSLEAAVAQGRGKWAPLDMMAEVPILIWGQKIDPSLTTLPKMIKKLKKAKREIHKLEVTSREIKAAHLAGDQQKMDKLINELTTKFPSSLTNISKDPSSQPYYGHHNQEVASDPLYKKLTHLIKQHYRQAGMRKENLMSIPLDQVVARYSSLGGLVFVGTREQFDKHWDLDLVNQLAEGLTISNVVFMTVPWSEVKSYMLEACNGWLVDERQWIRDIGKLVYQHKRSTKCE